MRQLYITFCFIVFSCFPILAQDNKAQFERIEAAKVAFISNRLDLSPQEAQKFFPIYNQYQQEIIDIIRKKRSEDQRNQRPLRPGSMNSLDFDADILACKKKYLEKFKSVVSSTKAESFFDAELDFRNQLFKELQNRSRRQ
ncbi:hypothetical protein [Albibacterium sp.]|uniref:hypothetical protein n=1 Tax=Albibacterium sp. TaxID=2952885 RepID=UPI002CEDE992|nr:hypothetical protein [Albibacterium sp.]HUH19220.1 hypothetical protein [Albibacterium sp.]